jgi:hypothetical protein
MMTTEHNDNAVREMLQRFARAFTTGDGPGAAACSVAVLKGAMG